VVVLVQVREQLLASVGIGKNGRENP